MVVVVVVGVWEREWARRRWGEGRDGGGMTGLIKCFQVDRSWVGRVGRGAIRMFGRCV